jgi:hypothetical protein
VWCGVENVYYDVSFKNPLQVAGGDGEEAAAVGGCGRVLRPQLPHQQVVLLRQPALRPSGKMTITKLCMCVCMSVCVCVRARACVCVCIVQRIQLPHQHVVLLRQPAL